MTYYPVIVPTLCRFEKFKVLVESLLSCNEASKTELIIGLDYPPSEKYLDGWKQLKEFIPTIQGFLNVICLEREENFGSARNSVELKNYALAKYDAYIYTEDDNIFSPFFLKFMNDGLNKYKNDSSVFAICGYSYPINWGTSAQCVLQHQYFSAWGYGAWKTKEETFEHDINDDYFSNKISLRQNIKYLKKSPSNFIGLMGYAFYKTIPSYDISRSFYAYMNKLDVLMPVKTLVTNDGWDGSGEHCNMKSSIDFSNPNRNDEIPVDITSVEKLFSQELEYAILSLKPKTALVKAKIKLFLIQVFGINKLMFIRAFFKKEFKNENL